MPGGFIYIIIRIDSNTKKQVKNDKQNRYHRIFRTFQIYV